MSFGSKCRSSLWRSRNRSIIGFVFTARKVSAWPCTAFWLISRKRWWQQRLSHGSFERLLSMTIVSTATGQRSSTARLKSAEDSPVKPFANARADLTHLSAESDQTFIQAFESGISFFSQALYRTLNAAPSSWLCNKPDWEITLQGIFATSLTQSHYSTTQTKEAQIFACR